jgi:plasmid stabilization system protein ParE
MAARKVTWTKRSIRQFNTAIEFIRKDSDQRADQVKAKILEKILQLSDVRIVHRLDPYKKNNDGTYLYFEVLRYRIVYHVKEDEAVIIRIRHTSMEPRKY